MTSVRSASEKTGREAGVSSPPPARRAGVRKAPLYLTLIIGVGLIAAPAVFQMFTRAPKGGQMLKEFGPFMTESKVETFRGYLDVIGSANQQTIAEVRPLLRDELKVSDAELDRGFPLLAEFSRRWPTIDTDMNQMLQIMEDNLDNFAGLEALPPFVLFPWFFVAPGVILVASSVWALRGSAPTAAVRLLLVVGLGLVAAPAVFQMFTRAPLGGEMIDDFRSLMTSERVTEVQQYFLAIAGEEGELRLKVKPTIEREFGIDDAEYARRFTQVAALERGWPRISGEMAPMVGAMSDNVDNFQAVDALPPFGLFPWFFVAPGVLVAATAVRAGLRRPVSFSTPGGSHARR